MPTRTAPSTATAASTAQAAHSAPSEPGAPARDLPAAVRLGDRILLPDLRGHSVEEVMQITEKSGLRVMVTGSGRAIGQDPPPGTVVAAGEDTVHVEFAAGGAQSAAGPPVGSGSTGAPTGDRG